MTTYHLRVHRNVIDTRGFYHTGYDLVTYHDNGSITIQTIDVGSVGGWSPTGNWNIKLEISTPKEAQIYKTKRGMILWGTTHFDGTVVTKKWLNSRKAKAIIIDASDRAVDVFNQIKFNALIMNALESTYEGFLDYDLEGPNCNTWTRYIANTYLNQLDVFSLLGTDPSGLAYTGLDNDLLTSNTSEENKKAVMVSEVSAAFLTYIEEHEPNFDLGALTAENISFGISNDGLLYNGYVLNIAMPEKYYIIGGGVDDAVNFLDPNKECIVITGGGNDTITGGLGNDKLYGGVGNDTYIFGASHGQDTVIDEAGTDTLTFQGLEASRYRSVVSDGKTVYFTYKTKEDISLLEA